ncbi:hypothetical protein ABTX85_36500 [Streptomyces sp. NPDC096097]|uniref:hypothetical protein n=1 Tax=Streptomyces sp. NPDC096097 TaxID=3155546 RepID=UPI0033289B3C
MSAPTNGLEQSKRIPDQPGYGAPSAALLARADRGLARFLGDHDQDTECATDGGEA